MEKARVSDGQVVNSGWESEQCYGFAVNRRSHGTANKLFTSANNLRPSTKLFRVGISSSTADTAQDVNIGVFCKETEQRSFCCYQSSTGFRYGKSDEAVAKQLIEGLADSLNALLTSAGQRQHRRRAV